MTTVQSKKEVGMNKRYPGRLNYTGPKSGHFLLPFHSPIVAWMPNIFERLETIDNTKPNNEIAWRRHCMVYIRLLELPPEVAEAYVTWGKAHITWKKARVAYDKTYDTWRKARVAYDKTYDTWKKVLTAHNDSLTALLAEHVPDHTWNGTELIFK